MDTPPLSAASTRLALSHLGVTSAAADRDTLATLLDAYVRRAIEAAQRVLSDLAEDLGQY